MLAVVPVTVLADSRAPLQLVVDAGRFDGLSTITRLGAGFAALGVLLNLIPGVSRTVLSMARRHELPHVFAHIDARRSLPLRAELSITAVILALTVVLDLRSAIGFSGVAVLTYYAITNASALTLDPAQRRWPRPIAMLGLAGCIVLVLALPARAVLSGTIVLLIGVVVRFVTGHTTGQTTGATPTRD
jgi:APA family basic amino acid/polyamine antiporter